MSKRNDLRLQNPIKMKLKVFFSLISKFLTRSVTHSVKELHIIFVVSFDVSPKIKIKIKITTTTTTPPAPPKVT